MQRIAVVGLTVLSIGLMAAPGLAQSREADDERTAPLLAQVPASARAAGLGNAYLLSAPDADAIFYNPALLDGARGITGSLSRFGRGSQLMSAVASSDWLGGGLAVGAAALSYGADGLDDGAFVAGEGGLWRQGPIAATEQVVMVAYARTLFGFRVGGTAKLIDQRIDGNRSASGVADVGVVRSLGPVTLGFSAQNLGRSSDFGGTVETAPRLPTTLTAAGATRTRPLGPFDVAFAGASSWLRGDLHEAGGGVEVSYWPIRGRTFTARAGYRWVEESRMAPFTVGFGYTGDAIGIDYAFEAVDDGRGTHRVTLRVR